MKIWNDLKARSPTAVIIGIVVAMFVLGALGGSAFNFTASNFSQADTAVATIIGTLVPILAGVAIGLKLLRTAE